MNGTVTEGNLPCSLFSLVNIDAVPPYPSIQKILIISTPFYGLAGLVFCDFEAESQLYARALE